MRNIKNLALLNSGLCHHGPTTVDTDRDASLQQKNLLALDAEQCSTKRFRLSTYTHWIRQKFNVDSLIGAKKGATNERKKDPRHIHHSPFLPNQYKFVLVDYFTLASRKLHAIVEFRSCNSPVIPDDNNNNKNHASKKAHTERKLLILLLFPVGHSVSISFVPKTKTLSNCLCINHIAYCLWDFIWDSM